MARKNKLGTPFMNLNLEPKLEKQVKSYLKDKKLSGKKFLRFLIKQYFTNE